MSEAPARELVEKVAFAITNGATVWDGDLAAARRVLKAMSEQGEWEPTRWWRVVYVADGGIWCETSNAEEAQEALASAPVPVKMQRLMRKAEERWEDA